MSSQYIVPPSQFQSVSSSSLLPMSSQNTPLLLMSSQYTIYLSVILSEYHTSCLSPTPSIFLGQVQPVHHLSCPWPVRILPPYTHRQSVYHLSCLCPVMNNVTLFPYDIKVILKFNFALQNDIFTLGHPLCFCLILSISSRL